MFFFQFLLEIFASFATIFQPQTFIKHLFSAVKDAMPVYK